MAQQVLDAPICPAGQGFQLDPILLAKPLRLLRQYHPAFSQQPARYALRQIPLGFRCRLRVAGWCSSLTRALSWMAGRHL